jgi:hypothetical protein
VDIISRNYLLVGVEKWRSFSYANGIEIEYSGIMSVGLCQWNKNILGNRVSLTISRDEN